jgi:hypothetical protein
MNIVRASQRGDYNAVVRYLANKDDIVDADADYAIQWAIANRYFEIAKIILAEGFTVTRCEDFTKQRVVDLKKQMLLEKINELN